MTTSGVIQTKFLKWLALFQNNLLKHTRQKAGSQESAFFMPNGVNFDLQAFFRNFVGLL